MTVLAWVWFIAFGVSALPVGALILYLTVMIFRGHDPSRDELRALGILFLIMLAVGTLGAVLGLEPPPG